MNPTAVFTTPLPTLKDIAAATGNTLATALKNLSGDVLFPNNPPEASPLSWTAVKNTCKNLGCQALDYRQDPKVLDDSQKLSLLSVSEFHKDYANLLSSSGREVNIKIATIHEKFHVAILNSLSLVKNQERAKINSPLSNKTQTDLTDCISFHETMQSSLHKKFAKSINAGRRLEKMGVSQDSPSFN